MPSGIDIESGTEGVLVDDNWKTSYLTSWGLWGHQIPG
jgi:hypothetical protein